ncbi:MAG: hypothetical protein WAO61_10175 [Solirubrobacterales bacterium]
MSLVRATLHRRNLLRFAVLVGLMTAVLVTHGLTTERSIEYESAEFACLAVLDLLGAACIGLAFTNAADRRPSIRSDARHPTRFSRIDGAALKPARAGPEQLQVFRL